MLSALVGRQRKYAQPAKNLAKSEVPEGIYVKCPHCKGNIYVSDLITSIGVCTLCGGHLPISPSIRITKLVDNESFEVFDEDMTSAKPLDFKGYPEKLEKYRQETNQKEAVVTGVGTIRGMKVVIGVMDSRFIMGSMGSVVGEKITRAIEYATKHQLPVILFTASGGARMQEGIFSLMQMAKTSAALAKHNEAGLLYISVLTHPTAGGVTASFAMLGDIILAEPGALIGFAGPRVIEQTLGQKLPQGFQKAEFQLEHGMIDGIVKRSEMKDTLYNLLRLHVKGEK